MVRGAVGVRVRVRVRLRLRARVRVVTRAAERPRALLDDLSEAEVDHLEVPVAVQ